MAVGVRGSTGPVSSPGGAATIAWPAGTVAGDVAVLRDTSSGDDPRGPRGGGWSYIGAHVWWKLLVAADLTGPLPVQGVMTSLIVYSGAGGVRRVQYSDSVRVTGGGGSAHFAWINPRAGSGAIASGKWQRGSTVTNPVSFYRHAMYARTTGSSANLSPGSVHRSAEWISIEVVAPSPPAAPRWVAPQAGVAVDRTQSLRLAWSHESVLPQQQVEVQVRQVGSGWLWVDAAGHLVSSSVVHTQSDEWVDVYPELAANVAHEAQVRTSNAGGWSPWSDLVGFVARQPPTVVVDILPAPSGDVTPTVAWTTTPGFGVQTGWELRLTRPEGDQPAVPVVEVPLVTGAQDEWAASVVDVIRDGLLVFDNGDEVTAWVRVWDSALPSAWTPSTSRVVSWIAPEAPSGVVVEDGRPPRVRITGIPGLSVAVSVEWEIGVDRWGPLVPLMSGAVGEAVVGVPQAPYGAPRRFRARSWSVVDGVRVPSTWVVSGPLVSSDDGAYLVSVDGAEWLPAWLEPDADASRQLVQGVSVSYGLARPGDPAGGAAWVDRTPAAGEAGRLTLTVETDDALQQLVEWVTRRASWWMVWPPERDAGRVLRTKTPTLMCAASPLGVARKVKTNVQLRRVTFDWIEQGGA